jgi:hypothetical protein
MRNYKVLGLAALIVAAAGLPSSSQAHHAFAAEFDNEKPLFLEGTVTKINMVNPHSWLYLDVKNKDGTTTNWGVEFGTPNTLRLNGLSRDDFRPGTPVRIDGYVAKNGGPYGYSQAVTLQDGRRVKTGSAPDAPSLTKARD